MFRNFRSGSDAVVDNFENVVSFGSGEGQARGADPFGAESAFLDGEFDVLDELDMDVEMKERCKPPVNFARFLPFARTRQFPEVLIFGWEGDSASSNPTVD